MAFKPLIKITTTIKDVSLLQDKVYEAIKQIVKKPSLDRSVVTSIALVAGQANIVNHGLGRILQGWEPCRVRSQQTVVWDDQDNNTTPDKTLILYCASDCTIDIEVF